MQHNTRQKYLASDNLPNDSSSADDQKDHLAIELPWLENLASLESDQYAHRLANGVYHRELNSFPLCQLEEQIVIDLTANSTE